MKVKMKSQATGVVRTQEIDITVDVFERFQQGEFLRRIAPHLSPAEREFLISGCTPEEFVEWDRDSEGYNLGLGEEL